MSEGRASPPRLLRWLAVRIVDERDRAELIDDLEDGYAMRRAQGRRAAFWYVTQATHAAWTRRGRTGHRLPDRLPDEPTGGTMATGLWQDVRYALRGLSAARGFTAVALTTLALGIGANTAVFSVVRHVLLAPLPYQDPDRAVMVWSRWRGFDKTWVSEAEAIDYQTRVAAFSEAGAWATTAVNLTGAGDPVRIGAGLTTPTVFHVLGAQPLVGRMFTEEEAAADTPTVAIISHGLWMRQFGGEPDILGRRLQVDGVAREVIGVMPRSFALPTDYVIEAEEPTELWLPVRLDPMNRGSHGLYAVARLARGATVADANAQLAALAEANTRDGLYHEAMQFTAFAVSTTDEALASVRPALLLVFGAVGFLLLIACANVANLQLVRADIRMREMGVRSALGASRTRLVRQLLTEGLVLASIASAAGLVLAAVLVAWLSETMLTSLPRAGAVRMDMAVLVFSVVLTVVTVFAFGLAPALRAARVDLVETLKEGSRSASAGHRRRRMRGLLVVAETALAVMLLTGAGLMARTLWSLNSIDPGFAPDRVLTMRLSLPESTYDSADRSVLFWNQLLARVRQLPGVEQAGYLRLLPLGSAIGDWGVQIEGYQPPPGVSTPADWQIASSGGPEALGERLVRGRWLTDDDTMGAPDVALVNEAFARKYWPDVDPIGRRFLISTGGPAPWITVVGLVGDVRHNGIDAEIKPKFYRPIGQWHQSTGSPSRNTTLVIRTAGRNPYALLDPVRARVRELDADLPISAVASMDDVIGRTLATPRLTGGLLGVFAALALMLAAIGIYGVLSYVVREREREIGIRLAIGADRHRVLGLVLRGGLRLVAVGLVLGIAGAAVTTRLMSTLLHGVTPFDPMTFTLAAGLLTTVAGAACVIPARRATRVNPVAALRADG